MAVNLPNSPTNGQTATAGGQTLVWDATAGVWNIQAGSGGGGASVELSDSAPSSPSSGDMWFNTTNLKMYVYYADTDGAQWIQTTSDAAVENATPSDTAPTNPSSGDIWFDTAELNLYVYYSDGDSNQWIQMNSEATSAPTIPSDVSDLTDSTGLLSSGGVTTVYANMTALIAATGMSSGDQALVTANNNLYIYNGSGWYKIATVNNQSPSAITGVNGTYELAMDGSPTTITAVSTDPEGFPLTWSYSTTGLGSIATITNTDGVFTITPSTVEANAGTFTLTISATDGINGAVNASSNITLEFIIVITNSRYTTLLATATSTGNNSSIVDSNTQVSAKTINIVGNPVQGSSSPYRHGGYAFENVTANNARMNVAHNSTLPNEFTIEFYAKFTQLTSSQTVANNGHNLSNVIGVWTNSPGAGSGMQLQIATGSQTRVDTGSNGSNNFQPVIGTWYHFAVVRDSSHLVHFYVDGVSKGSFSTMVEIASTNMMFGGSTYGSYGHEMSFAGIRIVKDTAIYTSNFTPPTEHLTDVTGTLALINSKNGAEIDESSNNAAITFTGTGQKFVPSGPFDNVEYDSTLHGGSISFTAADVAYVDNSSDFIPNQSGGWTAECWVRFDDPNNLGYSFVMASKSGTGNYNPWWFLGSHPSGYWRYNFGNGTAVHDSSTSIKPGNWYHLAMVSDGGSNATAFVNGEVLANTTTMTQSSANTGIIFNNLYPNTSGYPCVMTISDHRYVSGSQVYTLNTPFALPTTPLTAITNTKLLMSGTDASIIDKSQSDNLKILGNVVGASVAKFSNSFSTYFDASGGATGVSSIRCEIEPIGTGDYTVEGWFKPNMNGLNSGGVFQLTTSYLPSNHSGIAFGYAHPGSTPTIYTNGTFTAMGSTPLSNDGSTWYYFALVRSSNSTKCYIDGSQVGNTITDNNDLTGTFLHIGGWYSSNYMYKGHVQDFRITKGLARYTSNFTPPSEPLKG